jgi:hypothetical protein
MPQALGLIPIQQAIGGSPHATCLGLMIRVDGKKASSPPCPAQIPVV